VELLGLEPDRTALPQLERGHPGVRERVEHRERRPDDLGADALAGQDAEHASGGRKGNLVDQDRVGMRRHSRCFLPVARDDGRD
jgi:hypothetical protein